MNWIDIVILLPIVYGLARGIFRGFVQELSNTVAIFLGIIVAKLFAAQVAAIISQWFNWSGQVCLIIAYVLLFLLVTIALQLVARALSVLLKFIALGWLNRLFGAVFGALKWALIISVVLNVIVLIDNKFHFMQPQTIESSIAFRPVQKVAAIAWEQVNLNDFKPAE